MERATTAGPPVVLITGASSGIGRATAALLARRGYRVFGTSRRPDAGGPEGCEMLPLEVTSDSSVAACVRAVADRTGGRLDVLLNNAGTGTLGAAEEVSPDEAKRLFDVNFFGVTRVTAAVLPLMRARRFGRVLVMSSVGGVAAVPFAAFYNATKFALEGYAEALRYEVRPFGIAVSVVAPGPVRTPAGDKATHAARALDDYAAERGRLTRRYVEGIRKGVNPERVAEAVARLLREKWPRPRYPVGGSAWGVSLLRRVLSRAAFEALVRGVLRLR